jgi:hypothetical protein
MPEGSWGQEPLPKAKTPKPFNTVFAKLRKGDFSGTVNGVLILESENEKQIILDFQGSTANLRIVPDEYEVYDISYKNYTGLTTSGKTKFLYSTYSMGNEIGIVLNNVEFSKTHLDGCSCEVIEGINYNYIEETEYEYLVLYIDKPITLSNWQYLIRNDPDPEHINIADLRKKEQKYIVQPSSAIVFAIKKK